MQLNTGLYDLVAGDVTPGSFLVRIDGYDAAGAPVANSTDMVCLFIHNRPLALGLAGPSFSDPAILQSDCDLYRLTEGQMNTPMHLSFQASDPEGFVDSYVLGMGRCPEPMVALRLKNTAALDRYRFGRLRAFPGECGHAPSRQSSIIPVPGIPGPRPSSAMRD